MGFRRLRTCLHDVIDTDEGLILFEPGDTKHDGELLLEALRTVSDKPVKAIIYGHSHTCMGAGVLAEGNEDVMIIGHPGLNAVVEQNAKAAGTPAYFQELGPYLTARTLIQFNAFMPSEGPDAWVVPTNLTSAETAFLPVNTPVEDEQVMTVLGEKMQSSPSTGPMTRSIPRSGCRTARSCSPPCCGAGRRSCIRCAATCFATRANGLPGSS